MTTPKLNPHVRHQEKIRIVIDLVSKFGFASPANITLAVGTKRQGTPTQMVNAGILNSRSMSGLIVLGKGVTAILGLTKREALAAEAKPVDIWKVTSNRAAHTLIAQSETVLQMQGKIVNNPNLEFEKFEVEPQQLGETRRPDVVWYFFDKKNNQRFKINVEIELSAKDGRDLDQFFTKLLFANVITFVVFEEERLLRRYVEHAKTYHAAGSMPIWKKTNGAWWKLESQEPIPAKRWNDLYFKIANNSKLQPLSDLMNKP